MGDSGGTAGLARQKLQGAQQSLDDLWFGLDLQPRGAGGPSGVASKGMLSGGRDISGRPIGQLDVEGGGKRTAGLQLQTRNRVDFVGESGDPKVSNTQGLKH